MYKHPWVIKLGNEGSIEVKTVEEREEVTVALVNSGFESDTPQLLVPINLAKRLSLWDRALVEEKFSYLVRWPAQPGFTYCNHKFTYQSSRRL